MLVEMPPTPHRLSNVRMHRVGSDPDSVGCPGQLVWDEGYRSTEAEAASYGVIAAERHIAEGKPFNDDSCAGGFGLQDEFGASRDAILHYAYQAAYLDVFVRDAYFQIPPAKRPPPAPVAETPPSEEPLVDPAVDPVVDSGAWSAETGGLADSGWSESSLGSTDPAPAPTTDPAAAPAADPAADPATVTSTKTKTSRFAPTTATAPAITTPAPTPASRTAPAPATAAAPATSGGGGGSDASIGGAVFVGGAAIVALLAYHWFGD